MRGNLKNLVSRVRKGQGGFTLIEMIVVVGIIAVLAAVIVPNIGKFIGTGEDGAKDAEAESVQTAMNGMMAEQAITDVDTHAISPFKATQSWGSFPEGTDVLVLEDYLQNSTTTYFYCYDGKGEFVKGNGEPKIAAESAVNCY